MENKYLLAIGGAVVFLLLIASIIFALVRRGGGEEGPQTPEPVTLTVWRLFEGEEVFKPIFDQYRQEHPNVTIVYERKDPAEYEELATNAIAGGKGPDIWSIPNEWLVKHRDKLAPAPEGLVTSEQYQEEFFDVVVEDGLFENKIYGMPLYVDTLALYYNRELMAEALARFKQASPGADHTEQNRLLTRPPATWDDLVSAVKLIRQVNGTDVTVSGLAMGTADTTQNAPAILQALMIQNGASMTNVDRSAASFHLPDQTQTGTPYYPGTEALDFYTAFAKTDRAVYNWNDRLGSSVDAFMNRKAAMMINFQYVRQDLKQRAPTLSYEVASLPQIKGGTEPANVASYMMETVTKNSTHPEIAWDLIYYMVKRQGSVYHSVTRRPSPLQGVNRGDPAAFQTGARLAKSVYKPDAKKYDEYFREMVRAVVDLRQPPQTAIDVAANKVTQLLLGK